MAKQREKKQPKKVGRPRMEFDTQRIERMARIGCTDEEIAILCSCSIETIKRSKKRCSEFSAAIEKGKTNFKKSLRRMQYEVAKKGNATMLIWLGKQYLGQRDHVEYKGNEEERRIVVTLGDETASAPL